MPASVSLLGDLHMTCNHGQLGDRGETKLCAMAVLQDNRLIATTIRKLLLSKPNIYY